MGQEVGASGNRGVTTLHGVSRGRAPYQMTRLTQERLTRGSVAIILVGPTQTQYSIPMTLIFYHSSMIERSLNEGFAESASNIVTSPSLDPDAFGIFYIYITQGKIKVLQNFCHPQSTVESLGVETMQKATSLLCRLYFVIDYLDVRNYVAMRSDIWSQLADIHNYDMWREDQSMFLPRITLEVFRCTAEGSDLRDLVIKRLAINFASSKDPLIGRYADCFAEFPVDFGAKLMERIIDDQDQEMGDSGW